MTLAEWEGVGYHYAVGNAVRDDPAPAMAAAIKNGEVSVNIDERIADLDAVGSRCVISRKTADFLRRVKGLIST